MIYSDIYKDIRGNYVLGLAISIIEQESLQRIFITLGVNQFTVRHTADEISQKMLDILMNSNIIAESTDISTLFHASITDSGSNMLASSRKLLVTSIPCFSHKLHIIVLKNLNLKQKNEEIRENYYDDDNFLKDDDDINVSNYLISYSSTPARLINQTNLLANYMKRSHLGSLWKGKKMKQMVVTRWTSIFSSLLAHYEFIIQGKYDFLYKSREMINIDEALWGNLLGDEQNDRGLYIQILTVLYPIHILANQLQQKELTIAEGILHIFTCASTLKNQVFTLYGSDVTLPSKMFHPDIFSLAISIALDLENNYRITSENISSTVKLGIILSPYERNSLAKGMEMRSEEMEKVVDCVFTAFNPDAIEIYKKLHANDVEQSESCDDGNKFAPPRKKLKKDINQITKLFREQLHKYYRNSLWNDDEDDPNVYSTDEFWEKNKKTYNILFHMFLRIKAINPSNALIEGFFSNISRSLTSSKYNMSNETLDAIIKLKTCNHFEIIENFSGLTDTIVDDKENEENSSSITW